MIFFVFRFLFGTWEMKEEMRREEREGGDGMREKETGRGRRGTREDEEDGREDKERRRQRKGGGKLD